MKLRIKGQSLRLRVSRSELARILEGGHVEEEIQFTAMHDAKFIYALASADQSCPVSVQYEPQKVTVMLSKDRIAKWRSEGEVGVYGTLDIGAAGSIEVIVEKDFACLDRSDEGNEDTFANPHAGVIC